MAETEIDALKPLRDEVFRLMGRAVLRLQLLEHYMKAILAASDIQIAGPDPMAARDAQVAGINRKTLGTVVGEFLGGHVQSLSNFAEDKWEEKAGDSPPPEHISIRARITLGDDADAPGSLNNTLRELVAIRNDLIHHFVPQHDLDTAAGLQAAIAALEKVLADTKPHADVIRDLWNAVKQGTERLAQCILSDQFANAFDNGILHDGTIHWPTAGIICALRRAAEKLAVDGWTNLRAAAEFIAEDEPDQTPERYGCASWRQVLHDSRKFETRHDRTDGGRVTWYREKPQVQ